MKKDVLLFFAALGALFYWGVQVGSNDARLDHVADCADAVTGGRATVTPAEWHSAWDACWGSDR